MKPFNSVIALLVLSTGLHAAEPAKEPVHAARIVKIETNVVKTPEFQAKGVAAKEMEARQWIEIEAEVDVKTSDPSGYIPQLHANWYAVVMQPNPRKGEKGQPKELPVKLMGSTVFKDIRAKDGKVYLSAYIEPKTLERYLGDDQVRINTDFKAFALKLTGDGLMTKDGADKGLVMTTSKEDGIKWLDEWSNREYSYDGIVAKCKTPFALINIDRYPPEKVDG